MADIIAVHPLADQIFAGNNVMINAAPPKTRIGLRVNKNQIDTVNNVLSFKLPNKPKTSTSKGSRIALWLGPDEWLIIDEANSDLKKLPLDLVDTMCSAVDISHRNTAIDVSGNNAASIINAGCPQNLSNAAFPVGACSRTVLGKSEIILLRTAIKTFHIECWRSYSDYVWKYLAEAVKSL